MTSVYSPRSLVSLDSILSVGRPREEVLAYENDQPMGWGHFLDRVGGLAAFLDQNKPGPWIVHCSSAYAFLIAIFSSWSKSRPCILPPNPQPETLADLSQNGVCGILSDDMIALPGLPRANPLEFSGPPLTGCRIKADAPLVELFTSGSTGHRKRVTKNLNQLNEEIFSLEKLFGHLLLDGTVLSTVSHQHIYGLLFRLLWPVCAGRPFDSHTLLFWQSIRKALNLHERNVLVTSPSHLERVEEGEHRQLLAVFSSGGMLHREVALRAGTLLKTTPIEVLGSTETGGVGWRIQNPHDDISLWTPLPLVTLTLKESGELTVSSPHTGNLPMDLGDVGVVHPQGQFSIEGRLDRIIKRGEKKLSLDELETRLAHHPFVKEAHILVLQTESPDPFLGAAIQLTERGLSRMTDRGAKDIVHELRIHLLNYFDPTLLPKRYRWVDSFPRDSQGKLVRQDLVKRFEGSSGSEPILPVIQNTLFTEHDARLDGFVPAHLYYFNGHFPNFPIVPGLVQIKWALEFTKKWLGCDVQPRGLEAIKFRNPMKPGAPFSLQLLRGETPSHRYLDFSFFTGDKVYGSGRILLP
jgi:acyl-CoA synthetase (AMP-forming)/AMP-acid ligase II